MSDEETKRYSRTASMPPWVLSLFGGMGLLGIGGGAGSFATGTSVQTAVNGLEVKVLSAVERLDDKIDRLGLDLHALSERADKLDERVRKLELETRPR